MVGSRLVSGRRPPWLLRMSPKGLAAEKIDHGWEGAERCGHSQPQFRAVFLYSSCLRVLCTREAGMCSVAALCTPLTPIGTSGTIDNLHYLENPENHPRAALALSFVTE